MWDIALELAKTHGPIGAAVLIAYVLGSRHIEEDRKAAEAFQTRLAALETDRVTKHDLERVVDSVTAVSDQMAANQRTLLSVLLTGRQ